MITHIAVLALIEVRTWHLSVSTFCSSKMSRLTTGADYIPVKVESQYVSLIVFRPEPLRCSKNYVVRHKNYSRLMAQKGCVCDISVYATVGNTWPVKPHFTVICPSVSEIKALNSEFNIVRATVKSLGGACASVWGSVWETRLAVPTRNSIIQWITVGGVTMSAAPLRRSWDSKTFMTLIWLRSSSHSSPLIYPCAVNEVAVIAREHHQHTSD